MPFQTIRSQSLRQTGALIKVLILPAEIGGPDNLEDIQPLEVMALIDIGASSSCISDAVIQHFLLAPFDLKPVSTSGGLTEQFVYDIAVSLGFGEEKWFIIQAPGGKLDDENFDMLLGRDILSACSLFYNGKDNSFTLHF